MKGNTVARKSYKTLLKEQMEANEALNELYIEIGKYVFNQLKDIDGLSDFKKWFEKADSAISYEKVSKNELKKLEAEMDEKGLREKRERQLTQTTAQQKPASVQTTAQQKPAYARPEGLRQQ